MLSVIVSAKWFVMIAFKVNLFKICEFNVSLVETFFYGLVKL